MPQITKAPGAEDLSPHVCQHVDKGVCERCAHPLRPVRSDGARFAAVLRPLERKKAEKAKQPAQALATVGD